MSKKNEKIDPKALAKELLNDRTHGAAKAGAGELQKADAFAEGYKAFMNAAKTERETVTWAVQAAEAAGFEPLRPMKMYQPGDKVYYNNRGKALCLAVIGKKGVKRGVRIAAAHIDSPRIDLKPIPLYESSEMALLKTHYYGGIKKYQWTAIPLSMHGKIVRKDGTEIT
ncbi:MAG TPA: aminopeptidase, partial [Candidatus Acutalibacter stercoravium]|nr:aminopeptidase [Candidatus Acutalibacter stercoravium]